MSSPRRPLTTGGFLSTNCGATGPLGSARQNSNIPIVKMEVAASSETTVPIYENKTVTLFYIHLNVESHPEPVKSKLQ